MQAIVHHPFCPRCLGQPWEVAYFLITAATVAASAAHVASFARRFAALRNTLNYLLNTVVLCNLLSAFAPALLTTTSLMRRQLGSATCIALHAWIVFFRVTETYAMAMLYLHMTVLAWKGDTFAKDKKLLFWYAVPISLLGVAGAVLASQTDRSAYGYNDIYNPSTPCVCEVSPAHTQPATAQAMFIFVADALVVFNAALGAALFFWRVKETTDGHVSTDFTPLRIRWGYVLLPLTLSASYLVQGLMHNGHRETFTLFQLINRGLVSPALLVIFYYTELRMVPKGTTVLDERASLAPTSPNHSGYGDASPASNRMASIATTTTAAPRYRATVTLSALLHSIGDRHYFRPVTYKTTVQTTDDVTPFISQRVIGEATRLSDRV
jgi:hypothetical protein